MLLDSITEYSFPLLGYVKIPKITFDSATYELTNTTPDTEPAEVLNALINYGLEERHRQGLIPKEEAQVYIERAAHEFNEIVKLNFVNYVLLIYRIVQFCRQRNILNGFSRGSAGGSLIFWLLGATKIDPIKYGLLFERFISAERTETMTFNNELYINSTQVPDFDLDSEHDKRQLIIDFLVEQFPSRVALIRNVTTYQSKAAIKDAYKIYNDASENDSRNISNLISVKFGTVESFDEAAQNNEAFVRWAKSNPDTLLIAKKLVGLCKNYSVHASGIIILNDEITDNIPTEWNEQGYPVSCYDMAGAQLYGIKFDNLGSRVLSVVADCMKYAKISLDDFNPNDPAIYEFLAKKNVGYYGIFQSEEGIGKKCLMEMQCKSIHDIALAIAIGRPGSLEYMDKIIENKTNNVSDRLGYGCEKLDDRIAPIFKRTYGFLVFQEQAIQLSKIIASFTPKEAVFLQKCISKKKANEIKSLKEKFINGALKNGYSRALVEAVWSSIESSGNYSFNAAHAYGYGTMTALTVWLKAKYPKEFFLSLLNHVNDEANPIAEISNIKQEMAEYGIQLKGPDIFESDTNFKIVGDYIRFGMAYVKGVSDKTLEKIRMLRSEYKNKFDVYQGAKAIGINIRVFTSIIMCGVLDSILNCNKSRAKAALEAQTWNLLTDTEKAKCYELGEKYNYKLFSILKSGAVFTTARRLETFKKKYAPCKELYDKITKNERLYCYLFERKHLGFSFTYRLHELVDDPGSQLIKIGDIVDGKYVKNNVCVIGHPSDFKRRTSKAGMNYVTFHLNDTTGAIKVYVGDTERRTVLAGSILEHRDPDDNDIIYIKGYVSDDSTIIFANECRAILANVCVSAIEDGPDIQA